MLQRFASYWWFLTICGILLLGLGLLMIFGNDIGLAEMLRYLGFVFIGAGVFTIGVNYLIASRGQNADWRWYLFGAIELTVGLVILLNNQWAESTFILAIGIATILMGLFLMYTGLKRKVKSLIVSLSGVVSCVFGTIIVLQDAESGNIHYLVGLYGILFGIYLVNSSLKLRKYKKPDGIEASAEGNV